MKKLKIYLETTVFNWYFEPERGFNQEIRQLFDEIAAGRLEAYASQYVVQELALAKEPRLSEAMSLLQRYPITLLERSQETAEMARLYADYGVISEKHELDRLHLACTTVNGLDAIISFNFTHINRRWTMEKVEAVNKLNGYNNITINLPMEVITYEEP